MSDRIDHVAEALEFQDVSQLVAHDSMEAATFAVRHAHVHATLALVEQQRIANQQMKELIAYVVEDDRQ